MSLQINTTQNMAVVPSAGPNSEGLVNLSQVATSSGTPVSIYVNSVTGADNKNGATPTNAVKTFAKALSLVPSVWQASCRIIFAPGAYDTTGISPTEGVFTGHPTGPKATPLVLIGAFTTSAIQVVTIGDINGATLTGGALAGQRGGFLRFVTSVNNAGQARQINDNPAAGSYLLNFPLGAIVAGDTFVVETPSVTITPTGPFGFSGGTIGLKGINITGQINLNGCDLYTESCQMAGVLCINASNLYMGCPTINGNDPWQADGASDPFSVFRVGCGVYWPGFGFWGPFHGSSINGFAVVDVNFSFIFTGSIDLNSFDALTAWILDFESAHCSIAPQPATPGKIRGNTFGADSAIVVFRESFLFIDNMDISNVAGGGGCAIGMGGNVEVLAGAVTGTGNQTAGIRVDGGGVLGISPATTVTGPAIVIAPADLTVGMNSTVTTATVTSTAGFPTSGAIKIDAEDMQYSSLTATTFEGLTRGINGTTAAAHLVGVGNVFWAYTTSDVIMQGAPFGYITYAALATTDNNGVAGRSDQYLNRVNR